jgi:aspartate racemase
MRTLGMLGGMTPSATSLYYQLINAQIQRTRGGATSAPLLLHSFDHGAMSTLFTSHDWDSVATRFIAAGRHLRAGGAGALIICCNVGHRVADTVQSEVGLQVLHIAEPTGARILRELAAVEEEEGEKGKGKGMGRRRVVLLGTRPVMEEGFLRERLEKNYGIEVVVPDEAGRGECQRIIFEELGAGVFREESRRKLVGMVEEAVRQEGARGVVFACTELQFLVKREELGVPVWDTLENHAVRAAEWILEDVESV